ncbi:MAG TPA: septation protein IspZ, partial [Moraxellaceae bacterium]
MKQWLDFIPLLAFLIANEKFGIFPATGVLVGSSILLYGYLWIREGRLENAQRITLIATLLFGGFSLALHDEAYIKWKGPVVYFLFALVFLGSQFIGQQPLIKRLLGHILDMPDALWRRLNLAW